MAEGTVGAINVEIRAKADRLDRDLRTNERKVVDSASRMDKSMKQAFELGKIIAGMKLLSTVAQSEFNAISFSVAAVTGNFRELETQVNNLADTLAGTPLIGDAFKAGQNIGVSPTFKSAQSLAVDLFQSLGLTSPEEAERAKQGISGRQTDAQEAESIRQKSLQAEKDRLQMLKQTEMMQKRIQTLTRETAILGAKDDQERLRLQAQFKLEDATADLSGGMGGKADEIRRLAEQRFRLETQAGGLAAGAGRGQEIGARTALSTRPPDQQQPNKRQVDITNQLLQNIVRVIAGLQQTPVAQ